MFSIIVQCYSGLDQARKIEKAREVTEQQLVRCTSNLSNDDGASRERLRKFHGSVSDEFWIAAKFHRLILTSRAVRISLFLVCLLLSAVRTLSGIYIRDSICLGRLHGIIGNPFRFYTFQTTFYLETCYRASGSNWSIGIVSPLHFLSICTTQTESFTTNRPVHNSLETSFLLSSCYSVTSCTLLLTSTHRSTEK